MNDKVSSPAELIEPVRTTVLGNRAKNLFKKAVEMRTRAEYYAIAAALSAGVAVFSLVLHTPEADDASTFIAGPTAYFAAKLALKAVSAGQRATAYESSAYTHQLNYQEVTPEEVRTAETQLGTPDIPN